MSLFLILLSFIVGLILLNKELIILTIFLLILIIYLLFKHKIKKKVFIAILLCFVFLGGLISNIKLDFDNPNYIYGFVSKRSQNYAIVNTFWGKYYINDVEGIGLFDFVKIEGYKKEFSFTTYESSFDFGKYLHQSGVNYQFFITKKEVVFKSIIPYENYREFVLNRIENEVLKKYAQSLLFSSKDEYIKAQEAESIFSLLFNSSGILITSLFYSLKKLLNKFVDDKKSRILTVILLTPVIILNLYKFSTLKAIVFFIFDSFTIKKGYSKLGKRSFLYLCFLLIDHTLIYSFSFILSILFSFYFIIGKFFLSSNNFIIKIIKNKILMVLVFLPFYIKMNQSINFINLIFNVSFAGFFKILYGFLTLYLYGIKLNFLENIFVKIINFLNVINFKEIDIFIPEMPMFLYIIYFILIILILYFSEIRFYLPVIKISLVSVVLLAIYSLPIDNTFSYEISFINVGQGDCTMIRNKNRTYLIDTGGILNYDLATNSLIPFFKKNRIYLIDAVFITHYDYDHYGALASLQENFRVNQVYDYNSSYPIQFDNLYIQNLNTFWTVTSDENDKSLVLYCQIYDKKCLLMGDATKEIENEIMENYSLNVDILKLGHHGSDTSSSYEFLKFINPDVAIISCGKNNKYHHPSSSTLECLEKLNILFRRTDEEGTITYKFYNI